MEIQFVPEMDNNRSARLNQVAIVGRNDDLLQYTGGQETLTLNLEFYGSENVEAEVTAKINWLKSLTMNDGYAGAFRNVKLVFGKLFQTQVWAIRDVQAKPTHFDADNDWLPLRATVTVQLILDPDKNRYINDVRNGN